MALCGDKYRVVSRRTGEKELIHLHNSHPPAMTSIASSLLRQESHFYAASINALLY